MTKLEQLNDALEAALSELAQANALLAELRAASQNASALSAWRPIETAPRDGTNILLSNLGFGLVDELPFTGYWDASVNGFAMQHVGNLCGFAKPTHWMPLPTPPKEV